jgi:YjbE family integral membrane protein
VIDLVLSGDNAVVIGMAARRLSPEQRRKAIIFGAAGAIGLRVTFTALTAVLLGIPLLQAIGGSVLIWIAFKLLRQDHSEHLIQEGANLFEAVQTIVVADVIMSLDNILAVGGAAHGNLALLLFGLALSMPIIMFGSNLVALLMNRLPWLVYLGSAILAYTAGEMIFEDRIVGKYLPHSVVFEYTAIGLLVVATLGLAYILNARQHSQPGTLSPTGGALAGSPGGESDTAGIARTGKK